MSEIAFVTAPIGGGKSLFGARTICEELATTDRLVVTNLPMWLGDGPVPPGKLSLADWCHEFSVQAVDVRKRVRLLTRDEVYNFWLHYPGFDLCVLRRPWRGGEKGGKEEQVPDLQTRQDMQNSGEIPRGTLFVIDEVHLYFGARDWQVVGSSVEHYMSQLRKLNDDLYLITQHPGKVDKNFRRNSTEWIYLQNMGKVRLFGGVSFKDKFRAHTFPFEPMKNDKPVATISLNLLDRRYCDTYDTMAGVGLAGKLAPEKARSRGGHWSRWVAIGVVVLAVAVVFPPLMMSMIGRGIHGSLKAINGGVSGAFVGALRHPDGNVQLPVNPPPVTGTTNVYRSSEARRDVECTNIFLMGESTVAGKTVFYLSDGTKISERDAGFQGAGVHVVQYKGVLYYDKAHWAK